MLQILTTKLWTHSLVVMSSCTKAVHINSLTCSLCLSVPRQWTTSLTTATPSSRTTLTTWRDSVRPSTPSTVRVSQFCAPLFSGASAVFVSLAGVASLQATTRAPSPSRRGSSWVWWRRIKETAGWGSSGATGMRDIYLHPTLNPTRNTRTRSLSLPRSLLERRWARMKGEHGANGTASCCSSQSRWCCAVRWIMNGWC